MAVELSLLDTNVLISIVDRDRRDHAAAVALFDGGSPLALTPQILREFMVVASRPRDRDGLGLGAADAASNAAAFASSAAVLSEDHRVGVRLRQLVEHRGVSGKQIHDANIVASALVHEVRRLVTANPADFVRFDDLIAVVPLG